MAWNSFWIQDKKVDQLWDIRPLLVASRLQTLSPELLSTTRWREKGGMEGSPRSSPIPPHLQRTNTMHPTRLCLSPLSRSSAAHSQRPYRCPTFPFLSTTQSTPSQPSRQRSDYPSPRWDWSRSLAHQRGCYVSDTGNHCLCYAVKEWIRACLKGRKRCSERKYLPPPFITLTSHRPLPPLKKSTLAR